MGRLDTVTPQYLPVSVVLAPGYDRFGNRNTLDFQEGGVSIPHSWTYDFRGQLTDATLGGPALQFGYYDNDQLHTIDHGNGVTSTYGYKPRDRSRASTSARAARRCSCSTIRAATRPTR